MLHNTVKVAQHNRTNTIKTQNTVKTYEMQQVSSSFVTQKESDDTSAVYAEESTPVIKKTYKQDYQ